MKAVTYLPSTDIARLMWLNNFSLKISMHASTLGLTSSDITSVQNDAAAFNYIINMQEQFKQTLQHITAYKALMKHAIDQQHLGALPVVPVLTAPDPVPEGIFDRISKLVQRIKASLNYNDHIGSDLGVISSSSKADIHTLQPKLKITLSGTHPHVKCAKGDADAMDLYADHKDGNGFVLIGRLLILDYIDMAPLPNDNNIIEWDYKARYVKGNNVVGLMSSVTSVIVRKP